MADSSPPIEPVELHARRLLLRPWREDDVDASWAALDSAGGRLWQGAALRTRDDVVAAVARRRDWTIGDHGSWVLVAGGAFVGLVSVHQVDREHGDGEVGYWVAPNARGQGFAAVAVDAACRWAFTIPCLHRLQLFYAVENAASARVAEKALFTREGRLRQSHRYGDGVRHDELLWWRLATD